MADRRFEKALREALQRKNEAENTVSPDRDVPEMSPAFAEKMEAMIQQKENGNGEEKHMRNGIRWKRILSAGLCAAMLAVGTVCAYAGLPDRKSYVNTPVLAENSEQLTEVPQGWIGIYTAEDLNRIRRDLDANYILMNDIRIPDEMYEAGGLFENGFTPIGGDGYVHTESVREEGNWETTTSRRGAFTGTFNGNGYVISNLHIRSAERGGAGLFGSVETQYICTDRAEYEAVQQKDGSAVLMNMSDLPYQVEVESLGGTVMNLGIEDSSVVLDVVYSNTESGKSSTVNGKEPLQRYGFDSLSVGMIAGHCDNVIACYTKNVEITVNLSGTYYSVRNDRITAGGLVGSANAIDSCWSDADITLQNDCTAGVFVTYQYRNEGGAEKVTETFSMENMQVYAGGLCGYAGSCVTSYFSGTMETNAVDGGVCYIPDAGVPVLLNETVMWEIMYRLLEEESGSSFDRKALEGMDPQEMILYAVQKNERMDYPRTAHDFHWNYNACDYDQLQNYITYDMQTKNEKLYILDPAYHKEALRSVSSAIGAVFEEGTFASFCQENGLKYGNLYSYDLRRNTDKAFEGFDTENVWAVGSDGIPKLRLFMTEEAERAADAFQAEKKNALTRLVR